MDQVISSTANKLLLNAVHAEQLAKAGYTIFPFLGLEQIEQLVRYYTDFQKEEPDHFYSSTHSADLEFRKRTSEFIREIISPLMPLAFKNYRLLGGAFVVKPPHGKGILQPHQDWNIVNESQTRSFNLWIPLTDVTIKNGAVFVLSGSHAKISTYRGPGIPSLFKHIEADAWASLQPLPMKAGEALFYDHALLHGSPTNTTDTARLGIVCGVIAQDAAMELCFACNDHIQVYKADEHFFMEQDPAKGPVGLELIRNVKPMYTALDSKQYEHLFLGKQPRNKTTWFMKLFNRK